MISKPVSEIDEVIHRLLYVSPLPKGTTRHELAPFFPKAEEILIFTTDNEQEHNGVPW